MHIDYERFMELAYEEVCTSLREGNSGFSAVIVYKGDTRLVLHSTNYYLPSRCTESWDTTREQYAGHCPDMRRMPC